MTSLKTVYLDHNLLAIAVSHSQENAERVRARLFALTNGGYKIAMSAWHAFELAKSKDQEYISDYVELVEQLDPTWISNNIYVKTQELLALLKKEGISVVSPHPNPTFNVSVSQMWSTYGSDAIVGESFANTVYALQSDPQAMEHIHKAVRETPEAILTGREAVADGRYSTLQPVIDFEHFRNLVGRAGPIALDFLVENPKRVLSECPAVAIENELTKTRVKESFVPEVGDAADLQHAIASVAYCNYFISDDKMLVEHCQRAVLKTGLQCVVRRDPFEIPKPDY